MDFHLLHCLENKPIEASRQTPAKGKKSRTEERKSASKQSETPDKSNSLSFFFLKNHEQDNLSFF